MTIIFTVIFLKMIIIFNVFFFKSLFLFVFTYFLCFIHKRRCFDKMKRLCHDLCFSCILLFSFFFVLMHFCVVLSHTSSPLKLWCIFVFMSQHLYSVYFLCVKNLMQDSNLDQIILKKILDLSKFNSLPHNPHF